MKQPDLHASKLIVVKIPVYSLLLNGKAVMSTFKWRKKMPRMEDFTTRLSPSSLRPVSFRYDTTNGHTPTIFATTSTRPAMEMAFRNAGRDVIQSRVSAPFKQFTTNSVNENGSRLPNTDAAVCLRQRFISWRSNVGYSTSLARCPLSK